MLTPQFENIPEELKQRPQWVLWKAVPRKDKIDKIPYNGKTGKKAMSNLPGTWSNFDLVRKIYENSNGTYGGIGFMLSKDDSFVGFDFDKCCDPKTGQIDPKIQEAIDLLNSYSEVSPSGKGIHVFAKGSLPPQGRVNGSVEVYESGRFFTMTGHPLSETPTTIEERQAEIEKLHTDLIGKPKKKAPVNKPESSKPIRAETLNNEEQLAKMLASKQGPKIEQLMAGSWSGYESQSEADLALCSILAFWLNRDPAAIDSVFRSSGLMRPKWDKKHYADGRTYGQETVIKAIAGIKDVYQPGQEQFHLTDLGNAERFAKDHKGSVLYCEGAKSWYIYNGKFWVPDEIGEIKQKAKQTVRLILASASKIVDAAKRKMMAKHSLASESDAKVRAMLNLATSELPVRASELDTKHDLLNCQNGTLNLSSFELQPHNPQDLITRILPVPYDPTAECPMWQRFLHEVMSGKKKVIDFIQRAVGYSLTGSTQEHCLFYLFGTGANGKSTFVEVCRALLAGYAKQANFTTFTAVKGDTRVRNDIARLKGARFVTAVEAESGAQMAESAIKAMTGGDTITSRFLYRDDFEYIPEFKLWFAANYKLSIKGTDAAIWRRPKLIPFTVTIPPERMDPVLPEKLKKELPGILAWAVQGCREWRGGGLRVPTDIKKATAEYRAEQDSIGQFIQECLVRHPDAGVSIGDNFKAYLSFCEDSGLHPATKKMLGMEMNKRGFESKKLRRQGKRPWMWLSVGLKHKE